jgi:hypothetical protein
MISQRFCWGVQNSKAQIIAREVTYLTMNRVIWDEIISYTPMAENWYFG